MEHKRLCVCIPVYNRSDALIKVLDTELDFLSRHRTDLYIFDSGGSVKDTVKKYNGFGNLFYRSCNVNVPSNKKFLMICREMEHSVYDYIWVIHDHTVFNEKALNHILKALQKEGAFYLLKTQSSDYSVRKLSGANRLFEEDAWTLNSFGTAILSREKFIAGTDWVKMFEKYITPERYNYAHIGYYFERLSSTDAPDIYRIDFDRRSFYDFFRYKKPAWHKEAVRLCSQCWGSVISALPEMYVNKKQVMQSQDKWFLSKYSLLEYKKEGFYDFGMFLKYRSWIKLVSPEVYGYAFLISALPCGAAQYICCRSLFKKIRAAKNSGRKLCLYGAGRHGFECLCFLRNRGIFPDVFLVSSKQGNPDRIAGCPVFRAEEYLKENKAFVIITVLTSGRNEIKKYLDSLTACGLEYITFDMS